MIYIIGNTLFGFPKMNNIQNEYFNKIFIPYIKSNYKKGDILIHCGNIFYNSQTTSFKAIKDTFQIIDELSGFIPMFFIMGSNDENSIDLMQRNNNIKIIKETKKIKNITIIPSGEFLMPDNDTDYLFYNTSLKKFNGIKKTFNGFYDNVDGDENNINITSPYQLNKDYSKSKHGFYIINIKDNLVTFIENNYSPKFEDIYINDISDLEKIEINKNVINLIINSDIINTQENKNKIELFAYKHSINLYFTEKSLENNIIIEKNDIRNILLKNIDQGIIDEMKKIFITYDKLKQI
jgi:hypothetical protein